ncbi:MAG: hypothetical protein PW786_12655 [Arachidicoccus sp.]|nr:hypothetical protein [Arachidicoccus sp.]
MKAVVITQAGDPEVLQIKDYPTPAPVGDEVLLSVKAAGINRADVFSVKAITLRLTAFRKIYPVWK